MVDVNDPTSEDSSIPVVTQVVTTCTNTATTSFFSGSASSCSTPSDIAQSADFSPVRPVRVKFPTTKFGSTSRCFNPAWCDRHNWLEYSIEHDACYCYPCRIFGANASGSSRPETVFTSTGFRNWKNACGKTGGLSRHSNSLSHKQAEIAWGQYKIHSKRGTTIDRQMGNDTRSISISQNRHYIKTVAEVLLLCSRQEIAIRGHRESSDSMNRGNFLEILHLIAEHDPIIKHRIEHGPRNATYTSPEIQNILLNIMANLVKDQICNAVKQAGVYSILADESKDCSKTEQLAIVLKYVNINTATQHEHFLTYIKAASQTAESLSAYILAELKQHGLNPADIVSQGYDGASVMSGRCSGVQTRIKEVASMAVYVHCYAHCLNLVLVDSTKSVPQASEFFALLELLYVFMSTSKAHAVYIEQQSVHYPNDPVRKLQRLSDTRWACRFNAVDAVCSTFGAILSTLQCIMDWDDKSKAIEASGIYMQVHSFKFLTTLILFWRVLMCTRSLSEQLQSVKVNLAKAAELVSSTLEVLQSFRSAEEWSKLYEYVCNVASLFDIVELQSRPQRQRRPPQKLIDGVTLETTGVRDTFNTSQDLKVNLFYPILDAIINELQHRFDNKNLGLMKAFQCCMPDSEHFLDTDRMASAIELYKLNKPLLSMECKIFKHTLEDKELSSINDVLLDIAPMKEAFPELVKLLQIALTVVVSTAECERSFSCLRRTKTFLRSSMSEQRLDNLAILSIEKELACKLSLDEVVNKFAAQDKNSRIMLS